ncbi:hypothetical protein GWI33_014712 [Rhynchophorus ferrugineus]|uniref:Uncharacterized protein n=1 Tax=Rhynchophorus ferrugineus TaxID=354439 RepID=A0A834I6S8_RHYFE|nr:hypothetical protein GWI33_014712 [Rhynchophorus ferrugineus]
MKSKVLMKQNGEKILARGVRTIEIRDENFGVVSFVSSKGKTDDLDPHSAAAATESGPIVGSDPLRNSAIVKYTIIESNVICDREA